MSHPHPILNSLQQLADRTLTNQQFVAIATPHETWMGGEAIGESVVDFLIGEHQPGGLIL